MDFPGGSDSKESICNAGDLSSIPGSGRTPGEGNGYPLQGKAVSTGGFLGASLVAQMVKNLPTIQETGV